MIFCLKVSPVNDQTHKPLYETDRMHYNGSVIKGSTHMGSQSGIALVCVCVCVRNRLCYPSKKEPNVVPHSRHLLF